MISVEETTVKLVAATLLKTTLVAPVKPVPPMVTVVPPAGGPEVGETEVTAGGPAEKAAVTVSVEPWTVTLIWSPTAMGP